MLAVSCARPRRPRAAAGSPRQAPPERERGPLVDVLADDDELVAAEPRDGVGRPHGVHQPRPSAVSSASPAACPKRSLTRLKSSRSMNSTPVGAPSRAERASACSSRSRQQRAVGQPGQRIVQRLVAHLLLAAQPHQRDAEHVRDGAQEGPRRRRSSRVNEATSSSSGPSSSRIGTPRASPPKASTSPPATRSSARSSGSVAAAARPPRRPARRARRRPAPARPAPTRRAAASRPRGARRCRARSRAAAGPPRSRRSPSSSRRRTRCRRGAGPTPRS